MKRRLILLAAVILLLAAIGALVHSPPSLFDSVSGATPRAKRAAQKAAQLDGKYIFCINPSADGLADETIRTDLENFISGKTSSLQAADTIDFYMYVPETDYALVRYAKALCERLEKSGADVTLKERSNTMLRSRAVSGRYETFLAAQDLLDAEDLSQADFIVLDSTEMR